jgi:hypothetical protein
MQQAIVRVKENLTSMDKEKLLKLRGCLLSAWSDARARTSSFDPASREPYQIISGPDFKGIVLGVTAIRCINEGIELISEDDLLGKRFSRSRLWSEVRSLLLGIFAVDPTSIEKEMTQRITSLIERLEKMPVLQWRVLVPIENLVLGVPSLEIGRVHLAIFEKAELDEVLTKVQKINESSTSSEPVKKGATETATNLVSKTYLHQTVATANVEAVDEEQALALAGEETEHALNVLRFYGVLGNNTRIRETFIGPQGTISQGRYITLCLAADRYFLPWRVTGYLFEFEIDANTLTLMDKRSFQRLREISKKGHEERTDFEQLLVTAIDFYGRAINEPNPRNAYVTFFISLESLLLKEGEPRSLLAERVALVVGKDAESRAALFKQTRAAYKLRSRIIHHGFDDVTEDDVWHVSAIGFQVIVRLIPMSVQLKDIGQLVEMCTKAKFGGPAFGEETGPSPAVPAQGTPSHSV